MVVAVEGQEFGVRNGGGERALYGAGGGLMTVVRHCDETYESWLARALSSYRGIALRKAA